MANGSAHAAHCRQQGNAFLQDTCGPVGKDTAAVILKLPPAPPCVPAQHQEVNDLCLAF